MFRTSNLHLDKQFLPSYTDTTSDQFIRFAEHVEKNLMTSFSFRRDVIRGMKVVAAREGSIVLDILVLYSDVVTSREAFRHFIDNIVDVESSDSLGVKRHIAPIYEEIDDIVNKRMPGWLLGVIFAISIVVVIVFVALVWRHRKKCVGNDKVTGVHGFDNNGASVEN